MAKIELPYKVSNKLNRLVMAEVNQRPVTINSQGVKRRYPKKKVLEEIAEYCGVSYHSLDLIDRNVAQPSLALALKIAEYFNVSLETIFKIEDK